MVDCGVLDSISEPAPVRVIEQRALTKERKFFVFEDLLQLVHWLLNLKSKFAIANWQFDFEKRAYKALLNSRGCLALRRVHTALSSAIWWFWTSKWKLSYRRCIYYTPEQ